MAYCLILYELKLYKQLNNVMTDKWAALINFCAENPFCTINKLEIHNGEPHLAVYKVELTNGANADIKMKL